MPIPPEELLREEVDCIGNHAERSALVLEAVRRIMPIYLDWPEALGAPAEAWAALEAGTPVKPKLLKALSDAGKAASKAAGYDRKKNVDADPRARAASLVCTALDGALHRYADIHQTVTLGFVRDAVKKSGGDADAELATELAHAKSFNAADSGWQDRFAELTKELVPPQGEASTTKGELVRCLGNLADEALRNGNVNFGDRHRAMIAKVRETLAKSEIFTELSQRVIDRELTSLDRDAAHVIRPSHRVLARYALRYCAHPSSG